MSLSATHSFIQDGSWSSPALCPLIWSEWESRELQAQSLCLSTNTQPSHSAASFGNQRRDKIYTLPFHIPLLCYNGLDWTGLFPQPPVWSTQSTVSSSDQAPLTRETKHSGRPPRPTRLSKPSHSQQHRTNYQDFTVERSLRQSGALEQKGATMWWRIGGDVGCVRGEEEMEMYGPWLVQGKERPVCW